MDKRIEEYLEKVPELFKDRAITYLHQKKVKLLNVNEHVADAEVEGTKVYKVHLELNQKAKTKFAQCSCPAYESYGFCKHTAAVAIEVNKYLENLPILFNEQEKEIVDAKLLELEKELDKYPNNTPKKKSLILVSIETMIKQVNKAPLSFYYCLVDLIPEFSNIENKFLLLSVVYDAIALNANKQKLLSLCINNEKMLPVMEMFFSSSYGLTNPVIDFFNNHPELSQYIFLDGESLVQIPSKRRVGDDTEYFTYVGRKCTIQQISTIINMVNSAEWRYFFSNRYVAFEQIIFEEILKRDDQNLLGEYILLITKLGHLTRELFTQAFPKIPQNFQQELQNFTNNYQSIPEFKIIGSNKLTASQFASFEPEIIISMKSLITDKMSIENIHSGLMKIITNLTKRDTYFNKLEYAKLVCAYEDVIHLKSILSFNKFGQKLCENKDARDLIIPLCIKHDMTDVLGLINYGGYEDAV